MTDRLDLARRRAIWAKDARQVESKPAPAAQLPSKPVEPIAPLVKRHPMVVIQRAVAAAYGIEFAELLSPRRTKKFVRPRQVAMYLCSKLLPVSLPQIGRRFGDRDHTTVLHAIRKIELMRQTDLEFEFKLQKMMDDLKETLT
jgi:chromosomal replication initiation ATPase DnaA